MTPHDELDLQLRGWMQHRQSMTARPDLVDGALARTATVRQRPRILVRSGEPGAIALPVPHLGGRGLLVLGALLAALIVAATFVGSRPSGLDAPVLVWTERGGFHLVEPDGTTRAGEANVANVLYRDERCPRMIPGTTVVASHDRWQGFVFADVIGGEGTVATVATMNYAGTEYFALRGPRLILFELDGMGETGAAVTVVDLADPRAKVSRRVEAPGVRAAAVDETGRWLALATEEGDGLRLERVDLGSGERWPIGSVAGTLGDVPAPGEILSVAPDGSHIIVQTSPAGAPSGVVIVDVASGLARSLGLASRVDLADIAWSPDGRRLGVPQASDVRIIAADGSTVQRIASNRPRQLAWSPDGARLAFGSSDGGLLTVAPDGSARTARSLILDAFLWAPDGSIVAARASADGATVLERYGRDEAVPMERIATLPTVAVGGGVTSGTACLAWSAVPAAP